jgi:hypothetical protein
LAGAKLTIEAAVSKADHGSGRPAGFGGSGKFDHDLKARAAQDRPVEAGAGRVCRSWLSDCRDSMTLPNDSGQDAVYDPQPDPKPAPDPVDWSQEVLQREPLHFVVVLLLLADIVFGLGLAVFAEKVLTFRPMAIMGCGLAALGLGVLGYFVLFGGGKRSRW